MKPSGSLSLIGLMIAVAALISACGEDPSPSPPSGDGGDILADGTVTLPDTIPLDWARSELTPTDVYIPPVDILIPEDLALHEEAGLDAESDGIDDDGAEGGDLGDGALGEVCDDGIDNDDDGLADCEDPDCQDVCQGQGCANPLVIEGSGAYEVVSTSFDNAHGGSCGGNKGREAVFALDLTEAADLHLDTDGSNFDTILYVRAADCEDTEGELGCNDDMSVDDLQSGLDLWELPAGSYYIFVDALSLSNPTGGAVVLNVEISPMPSEICHDGVDNDDDGLIDCADDGCEGLICGANGESCQAGECLCLGGAEGDAITCADMEDNDCDGLMDCADPDCAVVCAGIEGDCADGLDNDGDGVVDCADTDCEGQGCGDHGVVCMSGACVCLGADEGDAINCGDGLDNDCDGMADCADEGCVDICATMELACADGQDNDNDELTDCADSDCEGRSCGDFGVVCQALACVCLGGEEGDAVTCGDGLDNDCDGMIDCADEGCADICATMELACGDGEDNDGDELMDCADTDCEGRSCGDFGVVCGGGECVCLGGEESDAGSCGDGLDNDCDGLIDCADGGCEGLGCGDFGVVCQAGACVCAGGEEGDAGSCGDGVDNDCDGAVDCNDSGCVDICATMELVCGDGKDNDVDGKTDCADSDCEGRGCGDFGVVCQAGECVCTGGEEGDAGSCGDGLDNDCDGLIDCDDLGCEAVCPTGEVCDNGVDDDGDGLIDCADEDCQGACLGNDCANPLAISGSGAYAVDTTSFENSAGGSCGGDRGRDGVLRLTLAQASDVTLDTLGSDMDTILYVRSDCEDDGSELGCNDDIELGVLQSRLDLRALAPGDYYIFIDAYSGPDPIGGQGNVNVTITPVAAEDCDDGVDNDNDGLVDCADSDCEGQGCGVNGLVCMSGACVCAGASEGDAVACSDGLDNDCDGLIDCAEASCAGLRCGDHGVVCMSGACVCPGGGSEGSEGTCGDGQDNDCDGLTDCADPGCSAICSGGETNCADGRDNDVDGAADCADTDCEAQVCGDHGQVCQGGSCVCLGGAEGDGATCIDGLDNDCDGLTDCDDPGCAVACQPPDEVCNNGLDDDGDTLADCRDPDCYTFPNCAIPNSNDSCQLPLVITANRTVTASIAPFHDNFRGSCGGDGRDGSYAVQLTQPSTVVIDTHGSTFDTLLYWRTSCEDPATEMACNDESPTQAPASYLSLGQMPPGTYYVFWDAKNAGDSGTINITFTITP